jgi:hypothetical protein
MLLLTAVLLVLLMLLVLLAVPLSLSYRLCWPQPGRGRVTLEWGFGLLRLQLPMTSPAPVADVDIARKKPPVAPRKRSRRRPRPSVNLFSLWRQPAFRQRLMRYLRDCWRALHKQGLQLRLRIGLDDPADTGQLWGMMGPLAALLANSRELALTLEPEFEAETFELESSGTIVFSPLQMLYLTVALLLSPALWQGLRQLRREGAQ